MVAGRLRRRHRRRPAGATATTPLEDYRGLARREPLLALAFTVFLLAQAGVPLTSGFFAKFYVLAAAVEARSYWLALIAMVSAVIAGLPVPAHRRDDVHRARRGRRGGRGRGREPVASAPGRGGDLPRGRLVATIGVGVLPGPLTVTDRNAVPVLDAPPPRLTRTQGLVSACVDLHLRR